ncbi:MAG: M24 family metallopeptidase, partial [Planctomyces sp.]
MFDLKAIQTALKEFGFDAWLLYDFRGSNVLAQRILQMPEGFTASRRYCCLIPAVGIPQKLVHRIETGVLDHIPGEKTVYLTWQEFESGLRGMISGNQAVAMEYSPRNANPYISRVDAGTVELIRSLGAEVHSSGDLISLFESTLTDAQLQSHRDASVQTDAAFQKAWQLIADDVRRVGWIDEQTVCDLILRHFEENHLLTSHPPIVAVGPNSGNPHYETGSGKSTRITEGSFVLIDLWAKLNQPGAVYSDLTRTGFVGKDVPAEYAKVFRTVAAGRDAGIQCVRNAFECGRQISGWEVDAATRKVISDAGY